MCREVRIITKRKPLSIVARVNHTVLLSPYECPVSLLNPAQFSSLVVCHQTPYRHMFTGTWWINAFVLFGNMITV